ncbi:protein Spindly-B-like isoform X2 [Thalassophryne amazonica]|uniref:protein Spindly-B-like isoform X2 n=1 Tax=Thalassophryne amazonica TaxID=390379 RepID=UPI0014720D9A|nr:protein Spindly-B-like isoform X2 [Thalassophryne amazonica]
MLFSSLMFVETADMQQLLVSKNDVLPEQKERNRILDQKDSELPNIKEEQEELWTVMSEDEEKPQSSELHQTQRDESTEVELLSSKASEPRTLKIEGDGEKSGGSQEASNSVMQQLLVIKEEIPLEPQEWHQNVDQEDIKEEQENLCNSQQLHQLEEADITELIFTAVPVKSEHDEKTQSSQDLQSQSDEGAEDEPVASSSTVNKELTTQADEEDYGGPQPARSSV